MERPGPRRGHWRVGRHQEAGGEAEGQHRHEQQAGEGRRSAEQLMGQAEAEEGGREPAEPGGETHAELVVAEQAGGRPDQPGHHRRMVEIADVEVLGVVPVIGFLRQEIDKPEEDQAQHAGVYRHADGGDTPADRVGNARIGGWKYEEGRAEIADDGRRADGAEDGELRRHPEYFDPAGEDAAANGESQKAHQGKTGIGVSCPAPAPDPFCRERPTRVEVVVPGGGDAEAGKMSDAHPGAEGDEQLEEQKVDEHAAEADRGEARRVAGRHAPSGQSEQAIEISQQFRRAELGSRRVCGRRRRSGSRGPSPRHFRPR